MRKKKQEEKASHIILKLVNGDEVIGELIELTDEHYTIKHPFYVITYVSEVGTAAVYLKRSMTLADGNTITILKSNIIHNYTPNRSFIRYYSATSEYYLKVSDEYLMSTVNKVTASIESTTKRYLTKYGDDLQELETFDTLEEWYNSILKKHKGSPGSKH